jgi:hypothetical protein
MEINISKQFGQVKFFGSDTTGSNAYQYANFEDQSEVGKAELDLMLISKKTDYPWNDIKSEEQKLVNWKQEQSLSIGGKVLMTNGKPMAGAKLNLFSAKDMILIDTVADDQGKFVFENFILLDSAEVVIRVTNVGAEKNVQVILDDMMSSVKKTSSDILSKELKAMDQGQRADQNGSNSTTRSKEKVNVLKTVEIAAKRRPVIPGSVYPFAAAPPDYTIEAEELHKIINLTDYLRSRLIGVKVVNNKVVSQSGGPLIILLNGLNIEDLSFVDPRSLTGVEIVKSGIIAANMANTVPQPHGSDRKEPNIYGQNVANGIIFLTSNHHNPNFNKSVQQNTGLIRKKIVGLSAFKDFYSPNYALKPINLVKDLRNPLFWNPNIITGQDGRAEINFYTSDEKGKYQVTLEGVGIDGQIVREVTFFTIN